METRAAAARCEEAREREALERFAEQYDKLAAYGESRVRASNGLTAGGAD